MQFASDDFKKCLGSFVSGVTIVTLIDASNNPQGVTINSFSSLSLEPAMVSFNLGKASYLHNKLLNSDCFAVNILSSGQENLSRKFAESTDRKWLDVNYSLGQHSPIIEGVSAYIECLTGKIYDGGDHSIITGKVVNLGINKETKPLVYFMGGYYALGEKL